VTFDPPLQPGILLRRYKRFLADIETDTGEPRTLHCPNTGSMLNCCEPGSTIWYLDSGNLARKYPCTWELLQTAAGHYVCINTARANGMVEEAIAQGIIVELQGYTRCLREVRYGQESSRIDLCLDSPGNVEVSPCYVEVKNVTLAGEGGMGYFPDAVSLRGQKHLRELMAMKAVGMRAVLVFCVAHTGIEAVKPADHIDPTYGRLLRAAADAGVEVLAYRAHISPLAMKLERRVPVDLR
jgi:sugar fermentation stimulation protein A